jgi:hypothetical protein
MLLMKTLALLALALLPFSGRTVLWAWPVMMTTSQITTARITSCFTTWEPRAPGVRMDPARQGIVRSSWRATNVV